MRDSEPQPRFGPSVGWLCHPCITATHLSYTLHGTTGKSDDLPFLKMVVVPKSDDFR